MIKTQIKFINILIDRTLTCNLQPVTPEMTEIYNFFVISGMLEKHWHPPADCLFFGTVTCNLQLVTEINHLYRKVSD